MMSRFARGNGSKASNERRQPKKFTPPNILNIQIEEQNCKLNDDLQEARIPKTKQGFAFEKKKTVKLSEFEEIQSTKKSVKKTKWQLYLEEYERICANILKHMKKEEEKLNKTDRIPCKSKVKHVKRQSELMNCLKPGKKGWKKSYILSKETALKSEQNIVNKGKLHKTKSASEKKMKK